MSRKKGGPRVALYHILKRTRTQLVFSAVSNSFLAFLGLATLTREHLSLAWRPIVIVSFIIAVFALCRNRILELVYERVDFFVHYRIRQLLELPIATFAAIYLNVLLFGPAILDREIFGPMIAGGMMILATFSAVGKILSEKGEASLLLAQCAFEIRFGNRVQHAFRWLDLGLNAVRKIVRRYGFGVDIPTVRLGGRLHCIHERPNVKTVKALSKALVRIEHANQLCEVTKSIESLHAIGEKAISMGILPQPRLTDYLDYRYLTLDNAYRALKIIIAVLAIVVFAASGRVPR